MRLLTLLGLLLCSLILKASEDRASSRLPDGLYAEFTTPKGVLVARLFYERAPVTVANFVALAEGGYGRTADGLPLYEKLSWYRVVPCFVIQAGAGVGAGKDENFPHSRAPRLNHAIAAEAEAALKSGRMWSE